MEREGHPIEPGSWGEAIEKAGNAGNSENWSENVKHTRTKETREGQLEGTRKNTTLFTKLGKHTDEEAVATRIPRNQKKRKKKLTQLRTREGGKRKMS